MTAYVNDSVQFDRSKDSGDPEDFRWILDLEGGEFHKRQLTLTNPDKIGAIFRIAHGAVYTKRKSKDSYYRVVQDSEESLTELGKVADQIGVDIFLDNAATGVMLRRSGGEAEPLFLSRESGVRYEINVAYEPDASDAMAGVNHFRYWYQAFADLSGKRFDIKLLRNNSSGSGEIHQHPSLHQPELPPSGPRADVGDYFMVETTAVLPIPETGGCTPPIRLRPRPRLKK